MHVAKIVHNSPSIAFRRLSVKIFSLSLYVDATCVNLVLLLCWFDVLINLNLWLLFLLLQDIIAHKVGLLLKHLNLWLHQQLLLRGLVSCWGLRWVLTNIIIQSRNRMLGWQSGCFPGQRLLHISSLFSLCPVLWSRSLSIVRGSFSGIDSRFLDCVLSWVNVSHRNRRVLSEFRDVSVIKLILCLI